MRMLNRLCDLIMLPETVGRLEPLLTLLETVGELEKALRNLPVILRRLNGPRTLASVTVESDYIVGLAQGRTTVGGGAVWLEPGARWTFDIFPQHHLEGVRVRATGCVIEQVLVGTKQPASAVGLLGTGADFPSVAAGPGIRLAVTVGVPRI